MAAVAPAAAPSCIVLQEEKLGPKTLRKAESCARALGFVPERYFGVLTLLHGVAPGAFAM